MLQKLRLKIDNRSNSKKHECVSRYVLLTIYAFIINRALTNFFIQIILILREEGKRF